MMCCALARCLCGDEQICDMLVCAVMDIQELPIRETDFDIPNPMW